MAHAPWGIERRFWSKVMPEPNTGCWLWAGACNPNGYGNIGRGRQGEGYAKAHRISWELHYGPIPAGLNVLHRCDVPSCVNPAHLWLGTIAENNADMTSKGRRGRRFRLTPAQMTEIRRRCRGRPGTQTPTGNGQGDLAAEYGVASATIRNIVRGVYPWQ